MNWRAGGGEGANVDANMTTMTNRKVDAETASGDWRAETLDELRRLILAADPAIVEEAKWVKPSNPAGVPTWSRDGIICTGETYKDKVKLTFMHGASLEDPAGLFNASLDAGTRRAIDIRDGDRIDAAAFTELVRRAVEHNAARVAASSKPKRAR
jgi:hypothetical protein